MFITTGLNYNVNACEIEWHLSCNVPYVFAFVLCTIWWLVKLISPLFLHWKFNIPSNSASSRAFLLGYYNGHISANKPSASNPSTQNPQKLTSIRCQIKVENTAWTSSSLLSLFLMSFLLSLSLSLFFSIPFFLSLFDLELYTLVKL